MKQRVYIFIYYTKLYIVVYKGEAIEKMLQEKRISSKINYEVLKSLNVNSPSNQQQKEEEKSPCKSKIEIKTEIKSLGLVVTKSFCTFYILHLKYFFCIFLSYVSFI